MLLHNLSECTQRIMDMLYLEKAAFCFHSVKTCTVNRADFICHIQILKFVVTEKLLPLVHFYNICFRAPLPP